MNVNDLEVKKLLEEVISDESKEEVKSNLLKISHIIS